jgi:hypothetical protein
MRTVRVNMVASLCVGSSHLQTGGGSSWFALRAIIV